MATYLKGASQVSSALQVLIAAAFAWWYLFWFLQPIEKARLWLREVDPKVNSSFLGTRGSTFLLQILPFMVIAFLGFFVIELRRRTKKPFQSGESSTKKRQVGLWSQPMIVKSPLGMLQLADIIFLVAMVFLVVWYITKMSVDAARDIDNTKQKPGSHSRSSKKLESVGVYLGKAGLIPFGLLWIPVSRGSPILRVCGVPFERAVKYHTWLGLVTVWLYIVHGIVFLVYFPYIHEAHELLAWQHTGIANFPGIIALAAGVIMLVTALETVRRNNFNIFFLAHHLYLVFFLFFLFHCQSQMVYVVTPILLFFLDRFMRMVQSRKAVDVLSTKVLPSGAIELKFAKPQSLEYNALSFIYVLLPKVSRFEWHPFSVASSPLDNTNQICIYIKPLGGYTKTIHDSLIDTKQHQEAGKLKCPFGFKLALEGPHGDESNFYLEYQSLILVAGGIGVTPFLAMIRDILYRHKLEQKNLPTSIQLIICVKNPKELCILNTLNPHEILPDFEERVQINIHAYVTTKSQLPKDEEMDSSEPGKDVMPYEHFSYTYLNEAPVPYYGPPLEVVRGMSSLALTGSSSWVGASVFGTLVGYLIIWGIFGETFVDSSTTNYGKAFLYCLAIAVAVVVFGGGVMAVWAHFERRASAKSTSSQVIAQSMPPSPVKDEQLSAGGLNRNFGAEHAAWEGDVTLGKRPNWKELFGAYAKQYEGKNVGVIVSGGQGMQEDVNIIPFPVSKRSVSSIIPSASSCKVMTTSDPELGGHKNLQPPGRLVRARVCDALPPISRSLLAEARLSRKLIRSLYKYKILD